MKKIIALFVGLGCFLRADLTIKSEMVISGGDFGSMPMTMKLTAGKTRTDMQSPMGAISTITLVEEKKMIMLMAMQKMYIVHDIENLNQTAEDQVIKVPTIERTGKKEKISGFDCEQILLKQEDGAVQELWISPDAPDISEFASTWQSMAKDANSKASFSWMMLMVKNKDLQHYPIRVIAHSPDGKETVKMTVLEFNQSKLSSDLFVPPADYHEQKIPSFGAGDMKKMREMQEKMKKSGEDSQSPSPEQIEALKQQMMKMMQSQKGE
ncbi:MAG: DUF4412 domain-containing protein [Verrucomicrobiota bacterium]